jgi:glyoxylase-like metal-dependent hydrolase (beta-lactamase superfamily II)
VVKEAEAGERIMEIARQDDLWLLAPDVACLPGPIVNVYFVGRPGVGDRGWTLIDTGIPGMAGSITAAAAKRFGPDARPAAILLTHGHFDHVNALEELAQRWDVPVYAHPLELPYLTGRSSYPPADPTVGGGLMTRLSVLFPRGPLDLGARVHALPGDGGVPTLPGWRAIHTPGHAPGHVSFFREADRLLIAGDAFVTTKQESFVASLLKPVYIQGPPTYFTPDWGASRRSVEALAALHPASAGTGHGRPLAGVQLDEALDRLVRDFDRLALPKHGRYVAQPAVTDERGVVSVPPPALDVQGTRIGGIASALLAAALLLAIRRRLSGPR